MTNQNESISTGEDYIICYEKNIAEMNDFGNSRIEGCYMIFPHKGDKFNFKQATKPVYIGGEQYNTVSNGRSFPVDVMGCEIYITGISHGDATEFAIIRYKTIKGV